MRSDLTAAVLLSFLMFGLGANPPMRPLLDSREALVIASSPEALAESEALLSAWRAGAIEPALAHIEALTDRPVVRDRAMHDLVRGIGASEDSEADRALLSRIAALEPAAWVPSPECREVIPAPLFDFPAEASRILGERENRDMLDRIGASFAAWMQDGQRTLADWMTDTAATHGEGMLFAFVGDSDAIETQRIREELATLPPTSPSATRLALRVGDGVTLLRALREGDAAVLIPFVTDITATRGPDTARQLLTVAMERDELRSAAIIQLGSIAETDAAARELLLAALGDARGGASAAMAIAQQEDSAALDSAVAELLSRSDNLAVLRRGVLLLRLREEPPDSWREAILQNASITDALRAEVIR